MQHPSLWRQHLIGEGVVGLFESSNNQIFKYEQSKIYCLLSVQLLMKIVEILEKIPQLHLNFYLTHKW